MVAAYKEFVDGHLKKAAGMPATKISNRTVHEMIEDELRYVLYSSRRLAGELSLIHI